MKPHSALQVLFGALLLTLVVFLGFETRNVIVARNYIGKAVRDRDVITIQGEGKVTAKPDLAKIDLGVLSEGKTVKETQAANTAKMNAVIAALKDMGIADKDMQTSNYSIYPKYSYDQNKQTLIGYTVSQDLSVKVRDLDKPGDILAKAGELGVNQTGGIEFTIDEPKDLKDQARQKAIEDARTKAEQLAKQLGLTIIKVVTFSESSANPMPPMPYYAKAMEAVSAPAPAPDIQAGSLDVISDVTVTFEVR